MTSWFTAAVQTVRDKSNDALEFVRKDLTEFTSTVKNDTETYFNKITTDEAGDFGINRFVSKLTDVVKSDTDNGKNIHASASFDRVHNEQARLQNDESTYLFDPTPIEPYENWRQASDFNVETRKGEIAQLLIDAPHVRSFYARLVPAQTTHSDFWSRYYFRLFQLEEEEARRTQLLRRAHEICTENNENTGKNNENDWDEPDEEWSKEQSNITQESTPKPVTVEHQEEKEEEEEQQQQQQPESISVDISVETPKNERKESDTVSGDSWEREFDETDLVSSSPPPKPDTDPIVESEETIPSESLSSSSSITTTTTEPLPAPLPKKKEGEFDDDWESW